MSDKPEEKAVEEKAAEEKPEASPIETAEVNDVPTDEIEINDNEVKLEKKSVSFNSSHLDEPEKKSNPSLEEVKLVSILKKTPEPVPPPKPTRPLSPREKAKKTLKEAFPNVEEKYIIAVLIASEGDLDPAFNSLLYLSDPDSKVEIPEPKAKPVVPPKEKYRTKQLEEDERLARRLAREFLKQPGGKPRVPPKDSRRQIESSEEDDPLNQFLDEDLPQFKKQIEQGFADTKQKVGTFFSGFTKQFQDLSTTGTDLYNEYEKRGQLNSTKDKDGQLFGALGSLGSPPISARSSATFKRDKNYDEEYNEVAKQYSTITMTNNDKDLPHVPSAEDSKDHEAPTKPALLKQESTDLYGTPKQTKESNPEAKKWEPLSQVPPEPVANDAFLVTSSDDDDEEEESKPK